MSVDYDPTIDASASSFVPPDAIVFSGGGPDGVAFIGCVRRLEERPDGLRRIKTIVGSSAGAIVGLWLALGLSSTEMEEFARTRYENGAFRDLDVEGLVDFVGRMGVDDGSNIVEALRELVMSRIRPTNRSSDHDVTFLEFAKATGKSLIVCATNLEASRGELMSVDATPDMGVLLACRMSFGVPLVFTPVRWKGCTYVDGCMFEFCPTAHMFGPSASSILSFRIVYPQNKKKKREPDAKELELPEYLSLLVRATMTRSTPISVDQREKSKHFPILSYEVEIETLMMSDDPPCRFDLQSLSLEMDGESITRYIRHGYDRTNLKNWDRN